ncbi:hypothetical protein G9C98_000356 [Cotesia typhae]|uniref:Tudor domain-containing protein 3 n=1 Tax=Cotesia typhae TaxID=2053667 RepID=A0A8J5QZQ4_9HYME|nr:hypothetical protein G9C98_000356 [Cotesia typhae]
MDKLKEQGWYLSDQGFKLVSNAGAVNDLSFLIKRAVDAIEYDHIRDININTPPGTKILISCKSGGILMVHGIIILKSSDVKSVLGGRVQNLMEKWELNRKLTSYTRVRSVEEGGPPPWIPFGQQIIKVTDKDKKFKSLAGDTKDGGGINKDNSEFEAQRQDAIAEASKQGSKKIFGGGNKQLLDYSVQKIVDQGFTIDQAEYALKINRNNVDRALKSLIKNDPNNKQTREPRESRETREPREPREPRESNPKTFTLNTYENNYNKNELNKYPQNGVVNLNDSNFHSNQSDYKNNYGNDYSKFNNNSSNINYSNSTWAWKKGDQCMAKYWEDNKYYNAEVTAVSSRTCVVQFKEFKNYEEVLQVDCIPITEDISQSFVPPEIDSRRSGRSPRYDHHNQHKNSGIEFKRGGGGASIGAGGSNRGHNKKRTQQRTAQPIYQPPAQRR